MCVHACVRARECVRVCVCKYKYASLFSDNSMISKVSLQWPTQISHVNLGLCDQCFSHYDYAGLVSID